MFIVDKRPEKSDELQMKAVALCVKQYLTLEESRIYLGRSRNYLLQQAKRYGFYKNGNGFYKRSDLDKIKSGEPAVRIGNLAANLKIRKKIRKWN